LSALALVSIEPAISFAADIAPVSPTGGVFKMVLGLVVVLAVMAFITWLLKRMVPGVGNKQSIIKIVGGVSVGSRERVVVLAIADRLIVVGVASGQVSSLANLEVNTANLAEVLPPGSGEANVGAESFTDTFAVWLKQSTGKILEKKDSSK